MAEPPDDKIELLVRSVLAAVDARLVDIRSEIQAVSTNVEQRHREVLTRIRDLEHRLGNGVGAGGHAATGADPLAARMEQATQVLLERIEGLHQRNTMATNERFALINHALEQLNSGVLVPAAPAIPLAGLDGMNAPLRVGPPTGPVPIAAHVPAAVTLLPAPPLAAPTPSAEDDSAHDSESDSGHDSESDSEYGGEYGGEYDSGHDSGHGGDSGSIDMDRLADLLSERLGQISLPTQHH